MAKKTPLPASSESDSSSDSDSDSSSDNDNKNKPLISSDTSATLSDGPKKVSPINSENDSSSNDSAAESKVEGCYNQRKAWISHQQHRLRNYRVRLMLHSHASQKISKSMRSLLATPTSLTTTHRRLMRI